MQLLGTLDNPRAAQAFVDYMALKSIEIRVKPINQHTVELWVETSSYEVAALDMTHFSQNPQDKKYLDASWQRNATDSPLSYKGNGTSLIQTWLSNGGWVTHSLIVLCAVVFLLRYMPAIYPALQFPVDGSLTSGQYWRWFTPAIFHFSMMHIAFNLIWWWMLGGKLEKHFSATFLLLFTMFTAIISNFAQFIGSGHNNFGGLSGVVYALIGFSWLYGRLKPGQPIALQDSLFGFAIVWLIVGYSDILWINMGNAAHLSGLLLGLGLAAVMAAVKKNQL